jgi:AraC family transcriptional regulator
MRSRYVDAVGGALEYIEANIDKPPSPADVASQVGFSAYHFHRVFSALLGESVTQYIRKRRLARAAERLRSSTDAIMELAVDSGFDSQEAFTRAFKRMYGTTPGQYRQTGGSTTYVRKEATTLNMVIHMTNTIGLNANIVERGEDLAVGMGGAFSEGSFEQIKELWQKFLQRTHEIQQQKAGYALGVCMPAHPDIFKSPEQQFVYVAAMPVITADNLPEGMVSCRIPAGRYAMFTHKGPLKSLPLTVKYIWGTWLPGSEYQYAEGQPDFEYYDERFDGGREAGEIEIYVPIR